MHSLLAYMQSATGQSRRSLFGLSWLSFEPGCYMFVFPKCINAALQLCGCHLPLCSLSCQVCSMRNSTPMPLQSLAVHASTLAAAEAHLQLVPAHTDLSLCSCMCSHVCAVICCQRFSQCTHLYMVMFNGRHCQSHALLDWDNVWCLRLRPLSATCTFFVQIGCVVCMHAQQCTATSCSRWESRQGYWVKDMVR